ncbi:Ribosomal protein L28/L24 [Dillenia turbinata]|uniref:Large ribosomal subunit protein bL28c n=1 Tax=Dillenia turbinata TaxID=194707 RepID=A0AAN8V8X7_9MAGN
MAAATGLLIGQTTGLGFRKVEFRNGVSMKTTTKKNTTWEELGFITSQLGGIKISSPLHFSTNISLNSISTSPPLIQPIARRVCPFTGKKANKANKVSFSNHKTKKLQFVNLQYKKIWWEAGKRYVKLRLSTKAIKTIEKNGLDAVAKKAGIDLSKE